MAKLRSASYYESLLSNPNVQRGLATIRHTEGTSLRANPYTVGYGYAPIRDLSWHPGVSHAFSTNSGRKSRTTAAGAYQFLSRTWNGVAKSLGLKDFSPKNQDIAALALIDRRNGLQSLLAGDVRGFVNAVGKEWASLPSAPKEYDQPTKSWRDVERAWSLAMPPLPPQRFQPIAAAPVAPTAQNMQTAMNLANIPARGQLPSVPQTFSAPLGQVERAALPDIPATPLSRPVSPTPPAALASVNAPAPSRGFGLVSSAQAAPMPSIPAAALGVGQITPPSFASAQMTAPATTTPEQRLGAPSVPSMPSRPVTPTPAAALAAMNKPAFEAPPSALTAPNALGVPQELSPPNSVMPTFVPAQPVAPPVTPVAPPAIPSVPKTPDMRVAEAHAASSLPSAPRATAMDVYNGLATQGVANNGNMVSRDQYGNTSVTNQYGVTTTTNPRGMQSTSRGVPSVPSVPGIAGPLGNPGIQTQPSGGMFGIQPAKTETGNIARGVVGSMAGSAIGSAAGPIGSIIGAAIGRSIAQGRNPLDALGGNRSGMMSFNTPAFGRINAFAPQTGGAFGTFPGAPTGVRGALGGKQSNRGEKSMNDISPAAAGAIGRGQGGLY